MTVKIIGTGLGGRDHINQGIMLRSSRILHIAFAFLLSFALYSCSGYKEVNIGKAEGMKVLNYSQKGIEAEFSVKIKNPNWFGFAIFKSGMQVKLDGIDLGEAKLKEKVRVGPKSDKLHTFTIAADFSKLTPTDYGKLLALVQKRSVNANIKGELKVGNLFYKKKLPVDINQRIDLNKK
jgi:LEA14-like dessication related protein